MPSKGLIAGSVVFVLAGANVAQAGPPAQLFGKSVVIDWSDTRSQRDGDNPEYHTVNGSHTLSIYISTAGRSFISQVNRTRAGSGRRDQAPEQNGSRTAVFEGQTMTVFARTRGGVYRTVVHFEGGFTGCSATTGLGFQSGQTSVSISPITGRRVEMRSLEVTSVSCSVRSGNVFGAG
jgi:hypothetical protein